MGLSEFSRRSATLKFVNGVLGKILPTGYVDGLQPTFFPPAPSSAMGHANLFEPFGKTDNRRGGRLCIGIEGIHTRTAADWVRRFDFVSIRFSEFSSRSSVAAASTWLGA